MSKLNDFDLDVTKKAKGNNAQIQVTSISLCTPGCVTGILMGCSLQSVTCNCSIRISK